MWLEVHSSQQYWMGPYCCALLSLCQCAACLSFLQTVFPDAFYSWDLWLEGAKKTEPNSWFGAQGQDRRQWAQTETEEGPSDHQKTLFRGEGSQILERIAQRSCGVFWRYPKTNWTWPSTWCGWLCFEQRDWTRQSLEAPSSLSCSVILISIAFPKCLPSQLKDDGFFFPQKQCFLFLIHHQKLHHLHSATIPACFHPFSLLSSLETNLFTHYDTLKFTSAAWE